MNRAAIVIQLSTRGTVDSHNWKAYTWAKWKYKYWDPSFPWDTFENFKEELEFKEKWNYKERKALELEYYNDIEEEALELEDNKSKCKDVDEKRDKEPNEQPKGEENDSQCEDTIVNNHHGEEDHTILANHFDRPGVDGEYGIMQEHDSQQDLNSSPSSGNLISYMDWSKDGTNNMMVGKELINLELQTTLHKTGQDIFASIKEELVVEIYETILAQESTFVATNAEPSGEAISDLPIQIVQKTITVVESTVMAIIEKFYSKDGKVESVELEKLKVNQVPLTVEVIKVPLFYDPLVSSPHNGGPSINNMIACSTILQLYGWILSKNVRLKNDGKSKKLARDLSYLAHSTIVITESDKRLTSRVQPNDNNNQIKLLQRCMLQSGGGHLPMNKTRNKIDVDMESTMIYSGHLNAYTSREQTTYYAQVLKDDVLVVLDISIDILQNSYFFESMTQHKHDVILREMEEDDGQTEEVNFYHLHSTTFQNGPLGRNILGRVEDIKTISKAELKKNLDSTSRIYPPGSDTNVTTSPYACNLGLLRLAQDTSINAHEEPWTSIITHEKFTIATNQTSGTIKVYRQAHLHGSTPCS
eukprot:Gb_19732 [translate_table: standard]